MTADDIVCFICGGFVFLQGIFLVKVVYFDIAVEDFILAQNMPIYSFVAVLAAILFMLTGFLIFVQSRSMKHFVLATVVIHFMLITIIPAALGYEKDPSEIEIRPVPPYIILDALKILLDHEKYNLENLIFGFTNAIIWFIVKSFAH